jgi:hypothetical protein
MMRSLLAIAYGILHKQDRIAKDGSVPLQSHNAPVAQLDRVLVSETKGRWFESSRAHHISKRQQSDCL